MPKRYIRRPDGTLIEDSGAVVDRSLTISGAAADAKAVGDKFSEVSKTIADLDKKIPTEVGGMTKAQISALDGMFKIASFTKDPTAEYSAFKIAFGIEGGGEVEPDEPDTPTKTLTGISATYSGGSVPVGTAVTDLLGILVTATYSDGSTETVTGYTLSGTISEGDNIITVSYGGKTTTFTVTGIAESGGDELQTYTITNTLSGVTNSNTAASAETGSTYTAILTAENGYILPNSDMGGTIIITMGGDDITSSVYTYTTGAISISPVTGNIVISVNAPAMPALIETGLQDYFDYRNAETVTVGSYNAIESKVGGGIVFNITNDTIDEHGVLMNGQIPYSDDGTVKWEDYSGTDHEWTMVMCHYMADGGSYNVPFPNALIKRSGMNHYPLGNYKSTNGEVVAITGTTAMKANKGGYCLSVITSNKASRKYEIVNGNSEIFNAADYSDIAYFIDLPYLHRPVNRTTDYVTLTAIYNRALTESEIAEVVRFFKKEVTGHGIL